MQLGVHQYGEFSPPNGAAATMPIQHLSFFGLKSLLSSMKMDHLVVEFQTRCHCSTGAQPHGSHQRTPPPHPVLPVPCWVALGTPGSSGGRQQVPACSLYCPSFTQLPQEKGAIPPGRSANTPKNGANNSKRGGQIAQKKVKKPEKGGKKKKRWGRKQTSSKKGTKRGEKYPLGEQVAPAGDNSPPPGGGEKAL